MMAFASGEELTEPGCAAWAEFMRASSAAQRSRALILRGHGANHQGIALIQLSLEHGGNFGEGVVGNSEGDLDRLQCVIRVNFPDDCGVALGSTWRILG